jgi:acyl dehydratase
MHLMVNNFLPGWASEGSPGLDNIRFVRPVRPGDSLSGRLTVLDTQPSASRPRSGKVQTRMELTNQAGDLVCSVEAWGFYARRP